MPDSKKPKTELELARDAREKVVRQAELALIELNDLRKVIRDQHGNAKTEPLITLEEYDRKRAQILRDASLTEEDLLTRKVYADQKGSPDPQMTWHDLERQRSGEARQDAIASGEVIAGRSLQEELKKLLAEKAAGTEHGPVAGPGAQAPRIPPKPPKSAMTPTERLAELDHLEAMGQISAVQYEVRTHEIRAGKRWTIDQRGRIETALGALVTRNLAGDITDREYDQERKGLLDG